MPASVLDERARFQPSTSTRKCSKTRNEVPTLTVWDGPAAVLDESARSQPSTSTQKCSKTRFDFTTLTVWKGQGDSR
ncbi:hypothetical protein MAR_034607 [Mya arenaria]|uniref:Uncharacterized protein n=1 Tax=Mya arenaria TaxID=6604 RepID=A0ABY7ELB3_MYAAR|nr:hypothetical protein MAR_034607 [Mya arenaria]